MAETEWVRARDTRLDEDNILPNLVPRAFLEIFPHLKEVPSARLKADRVPITEPVQPGALALGSTEMQEPKATAARGKAKSIKEPATPDTK